MLRETVDEEDEYFPYVDEDEQLLGVLHRSALKAAPKRHRQLWQRQWIAMRTQQGAAARAYGAIDRALTHSESAGSNRLASPTKPPAPSPPRPSASPAAKVGRAVKSAASFDRFDRRAPTLTLDRRS